MATDRQPKREGTTEPRPACSARGQGLPRSPPERGRAAAAGAFVTPSARAPPPPPRAALCAVAVPGCSAAAGGCGRLVAAGDGPAGAMAPAMQPAELQFAQRLASHEKGIRDRAVKKLRQYISVKTQRETGGRPAVIRATWRPGRGGAGGSRGRRCLAPVCVRAAGTAARRVQPTVTVEGLASVPKVTGSGEAGSGPVCPALESPHRARACLLCSPWIHALTGPTP